MHTPRGRVKFHKDKQGLPYIDLDRSAQEAASMLVQLGIEQHAAMTHPGSKDEHTMLIETVRGNFKGFTKNKILRAKQARRAQTMMGNPSEKDYKVVVGNHLISNCPVSTTDITNS
jgi:hypothetical protein